jgi:hypothetical protein
MAVNYNMAELQEAGVSDFKYLMRRAVTLHRIYLLNMGFEKKQVASLIISQMEDVASEVRATLK